MRKILRFLKKLIGLSSPPALLVYRGYGSRHKVFFKGHVLDDRVVYEAQKGDKARKNIRAALFRYLSVAMPDVRLEISFGGQTVEAVTDETGFFFAVLEFTKPLSHTGWQKATYKILGEMAEPGAVMEASGDVLIVSEDQKTAVISDIDDTALISYSTEPFKKLRLVLLKNAYTRMPFEGVAEFYSTIHRGTASGGTIPFFYVSSSEWNLYDFLEDFFREKGFPKGPFFLKELETNPLNLLRKSLNHNHKYLQAEHLLNVFPAMRFVLFGDSGQMDVDIYSRLAQKYPDQVWLIIIRAVSNASRHATIQKSAERLAAVGIKLHLVQNTNEAWEIVAKYGIIPVANPTLGLPDINKINEQ